MTDIFPFNSYRLRNGNTFVPSQYHLHGLNFRAVLPDTKVARDEVVKILYDYHGVPLTLTGKWNNRLQDWLFDYLIGLSEGGEKMRAIYDALREKLEQQDNKEEETS